MMDERARRVLRQAVETERLFGVDAVPRRAPAAPEQERSAMAREPDEPPPETSMFAANEEAAADLPQQTEEKQRLLDALAAEEVSGCTACALCEGRTQTVFGEGSPDAPILFIGEGPGGSEDEQGRPFVGRAGELLTKMIAAMGYDRGDLYIANIVKCRPPNNRTPEAREVEACAPYLRRQIELIRPKVLVSLGGPATKHLLGTRQGITAVRGTWHTYRALAERIGALPVMPTFHPAFLLRSYTRENRQKVWDDLQKVLQAVG
jgi:DNA polymerase